MNFLKLSFKIKYGNNKYLNKGCLHDWLISSIFLSNAPFSLIMFLLALIDYGLCS